MRRSCVACVVGLFVLTASASGGVAADKSRYSLFDPTPQRVMREMTTDRPDATESPFTIDAGHLQVESNVFGYARSRSDTDGAVTDSYDFAVTNTRIGLTNDTEINVVWQPYGVGRTHQAGGGLMQESGVGGVDIRGKLNLWGNDTFDRTGSALAVLPYLTLPTEPGNGISPAHAEGGIIFPLAVALPHGFGLGINGGAAWIRSEGKDGYQTEFLASAALSYEWTQALGAYYEIAAVLDTEDARGDIVVVGTGVTYALTDNLQLDAGVNLGITSAADRFNPFVGVSSRF